MDTTREIIYRGFTLNPDTEDALAAITPGGGAGTGISGCFIDAADLSDVDVVQWMEKRSQADGMDAGDVTEGARRIRLSGTLSATSRLQLFDDYWSLRAALNAVLAQREEPADKGYRPLYFSTPTARDDDYPDGAIELQVFAMPRAFQAVMNRDSQGGEDDDALSIPWQATLICRDPGIYSADPVEVDFTATSTVSGTTGANATDLFTKVAHGLTAGSRITFLSKSGGSGLNLSTAYYVLSSGLTSSAFKLSLTSGGSVVDLGSDVTASVWIKSSTASGTWSNRGTFLGSLNMLVEVGAGAGTIVATVGDSVFTVTVAASTGNRIIRIKGANLIDGKVLTMEEDDVELPKMSSIVFEGDTTWPLIDPGDTAYSVTFHGMGGVKAGSLMWFYENYA